MASSLKEKQEFFQHAKTLTHMKGKCVSHSPIRSSLFTLSSSGLTPSFWAASGTIVSSPW